MYSAVLLLHSWLRWVVIVGVLLALIRGIAGWGGARRWTSTDDGVSRLATIALDLQALLGLLLYVGLSPTVAAAFTNLGGAMRDPALRFFLVEHAFGMIVALALVHIGRVRARRAPDNGNKHRALAIFFGLALVIVLGSIPWPFMPGARPLFRF